MASGNVADSSRRAEKEAFLIDVPRELEMFHPSTRNFSPMSKKSILGKTCVVEGVCPLRTGNAL
jgi:hypothetical protein